MNTKHILAVIGKVRETRNKFDELAECIEILEEEITRHLETLRRNSRRIHEERDAAGLCTICGNPRDLANRRLCSSCLEHRRNYERERYARRKGEMK